VSNTIIGSLQMVFSVLVVSTWVYKSYYPALLASGLRSHHYEVYSQIQDPISLPRPVLLIEFISCVFFGFSYLREHLRHECSIKHALKLECMLDVLCVASLVVAAGNHSACQEEDTVCEALFPETTWLTLTYLRAMRVQMAWSELDESGVLDNLQPVTRFVPASVVRLATIVTSFAATMLVLELLGDPPGFSDKSLQVPMGDVSFFMQTYFIIG